MKRQSPPKAAASIALFPFLAVLLCAMGGLIILLVVISRHAKQQGAVDIQAAITAHDDLELRRSDIQWRNGHLRASRDKTAEDLAERRAEISHIEDHARRLRDQLAELERAMAEFDGHAAVKEQNTAQMRARLRELEQQRRAAEEEAAGNKRARPKNQSYAVIPYAGPHQTHRRPIYVECRSDAIILQPEGIELVDTDFFGPMGPGNPLAAGLRAAREYLVSRVESNPADNGEPYPLLLVRPDGILSYYTAREAMSSWGSEFGYEFIDQDWKLEYRQPDPAMILTMARAIDDARRRQETLAVAAPRLINARQRQAYRSQSEGRGNPSATGLAAVYGESSSESGVPGGTDVGMANSGATTGTDGGVPSSRLGPGGAGGAQGGTNAAGALAASASSGGAGTAAGGNGASTRGQTGSSGGLSSTAGGTQPGSAQATSMQTLKFGQPAAGATASANQQSQAVSAEGPTLKGLETQGRAFASQSRFRAGEATDSPPTAEETRTPKRSLAKSRGKDWTLPEDHQAAVAVTRPIFVRCFGDHLVIADDSGEQDASQVIPLDYRTQDSVDTLVNCIHQRIDSWGIAGRGMYWRPMLVVEVAADGRSRFADLRELLNDSGLELCDKATDRRADIIPQRY